MDAALKQLIAISQEVGADPQLVQGGGGNTSVKTSDGRFMYIKASGGAIRDINETAGWRLLDVGCVQSILSDVKLAALSSQERESEISRRLIACCEDDFGASPPPSVESHLHASLGQCVIHLHPTVIGAYVCAKQGRERIAQIFRDAKKPPLWVPYANPGFGLAVRLKQLIQQFQQQHGQEPEVIFLEKHGLIITASTPTAAVRQVQAVISRCEAGLKVRTLRKTIPAPTTNQIVQAQFALRRSLWKKTGTHYAIGHFLDQDIAAYLALPEAKQLVAGAPLTPEELACAHGAPAWIAPWDDSALQRVIAKRIAQDGRPPLAFLQSKLGLFIAGTDKSIPSLRDLIVSALTIRRHASTLGGVLPLTPAQRKFIAEWDAEALRRQTLAGRQTGAIANHIAVVSGAGSGLGRAIALGLAQAGATVGLADIDFGAAQETARLISASSPAAVALPIRCDVTNEASVDVCIGTVIKQWGGLDILVNAAGVAPAAPLVELDISLWRRALEINLTGYVLMARAAARIMVAQGMGGNIINLSSKSGLEASRSNTAYNATKAGEIHMARGWALELGSHGIRVNSIAPGNVFQGSRIWNQEYIEECAKKYGLRPEEVIPHYVNMTALKREIKGEDIAEAVIFLCSDRARTITGQTLVVDSGQVMVR